MDLNDITVTKGYLQYKEHRSALISLINEYRTDPMGGGLDVLTSENEELLIKGLLDHPSKLILFAKFRTQIIGMAVCFWGFSTFQAKNLLNIHDLIVYKEHRGKGIGKLLLQYASKEAKQKGSCRLTLEVRTDNAQAQQLYRTMGFTPCESPMEFWVCQL